MLQRVYKTILRENWFVRTDQNERQFARLIVRFFQNGIHDEDRLFTESLSVARACYCSVVSNASQDQPAAEPLPECEVSKQR